jgi:hypothetical protein
MVTTGTFGFERKADLKCSILPPILRGLADTLGAVVSYSFGVLRKCSKHVSLTL